MLKKFLSLFLSFCVILCFININLFNVNSLEASHVHSLTGENSTTCLVCDLAYKINSLPTAEEITNDNSGDKAGEAYNLIQEIDAIKFDLTDDEYYELEKLVGKNIPKYFEAIQALQSLHGSIDLTIQKEIILDTGEEIPADDERLKDYSVSFEIEPVVGTSALSTNMLIETDLPAQNSDKTWVGPAMTYGLTYNTDSSRAIGLTNTYSLPAGTYKIRETNLDKPFVIDGQTYYTTSVTYKYNGKEISDGSNINLSAGDTNVIEVLNSMSSNPDDISEEVLIPDENLRAALRQALIEEGIIDESGKISTTALQALTNLYATGRDVKDLTGLENCTGLEILCLGDNPNLTGDSLKHISDLKNLKDLQLLCTNVDSLANIQYLKNLEYLDLRETPIKDLAPLSNLTKLENLDLEHWHPEKKLVITDLSPLENLVELKKLRMNFRFDELPEDFSAVLEKLTKLEILDLCGCGVINDDLLKISKAANLTDLGLYNNSISDISLLTSLTNLTNLDLRVNQITDISALEMLKALEFLDLGYNQLSDLDLSDTAQHVLSPLKSLTKLTYLRLDGNQIEDILPIASLTNLTNLDLSVNQITDISALEMLKALEFLDLGYNQISDFSPLGQIETLKELRLIFTNMSDSDILHLTGLKNLNSLSLYGNNISNISPLKELPNLNQLDLGANKILDISPLRSLTNLTNLDLSANQITDISLLDSLTNLQTLYCGEQSIVLDNIVVDDVNKTVSSDLPILRSLNDSDQFTFEIYPSGTVDVENKKLTWTSFPIFDGLRCNFSVPVSIGDVTDATFSGTLFSPYQSKKTYGSLSATDENGIVWLQEDTNDEKTSWFGLKLGTVTSSKDSDGNEVDLSDKYFYVEWISPEEMLHHPEYENLDPDVKSQIQESRGKLFYAGICDEYGNKINVEFSADDPAKLYVKVGEDWETQDLQSVFITTDKDQPVVVSYDENITDPEGENGYAVMNLTHFSPYFTYDAENSGVGDSPVQAPSSSSGSSNKNDSEEKLEEDKNEELQDDYNNLESVLKDFFITGDSKTKIIAWSTVGLILAALGVLVFMRKYNKIK